MSDTSGGPGWWLASDGRWYPPEAWTGPPRQSDATAFSAGMPSYPGGGGAPPYAGYGGAPVYGSYPYAAPPRSNGLAIASLICSCVGPFLFGVPCVLGIIFGFVARSQIKRSNGTQQGGGMALAGIIVGFSLIGIFIIGIILVVTLGHSTNCITTNGQISCDVN